MSKVIKASGSKWICLSFSLPSSYNPVHMHVHTCDQHILSFHYYFLHLSPSLAHTLANNFNFTFAFLIKRGSDEQKHLQRLRNPTKWKTSSCKSIYCSSIAERGHTHTHTYTYTQWHSKVWQRASKRVPDWRTDRQSFTWFVCVSLFSLLLSLSLLHRSTYNSHPVWVQSVTSDATRHALRNTYTRSHLLLAGKPFSFSLSLSIAPLALFRQTPR